jgi:transposase
MQTHYEWLKRQVFGQKSERFIPQASPGHDDLFGFAGQEADCCADETEEKEIRGHIRKKRKKKSSKVAFSDEVTVVKKVLDIPEEEKVCPETGEPLKCIGVDSKEQLFCVPGKFLKLITERPKYARSIDTDKGPKTIVHQQKAEPELIRGTKFHHTFMAYLLVQKYVFHIPLNRTIEELQYNGITVSSQALSGLIINIGSKLKALYELMMKELLKQKYLFTDDTGGKMLEKGRGQAKNTYIWAYIGGEPGKPQYIIYKHTQGRKHDDPRNHLDGFKGTITADAFGGYEKLENDPESGINWNACWCHARREFESCIKSSKYARGVMSMIQELFMVERQCWKTDSTGRLAIRQDVQKIYVDAIFEELLWMSENLPLVPGTPLHKAVHYMLKRPTVFKRFLDDPNLRIENNTAEHAMRKFVIGRKNWMFFGSERGAEAGCTIMSFAQTCRVMEINPTEYFEDILKRLASIDTNDTKALKKLLPDQWLKHRNLSTQ